ncbi:MAG TPA: hypothetical protein VL588_09285, partial [Bdellovibrionota bacterium]|nr:hypothetical protein [Bdellovibrionota bacterium]
MKKSALLLLAISFSAHAGGKHLHLGHSGHRLAHGGNGYRVLVTDADETGVGEVYVASSTIGKDATDSYQAIERRDVQGTWTAVLDQPTVAPVGWEFQENYEVDVLSHQGAKVSPEAPLWVGWKDPKNLVLKSFDGASWTEVKRVPRNNGWFNGISGKGQDLVWAYGLIARPDSEVTEGDGLLPFAWLYDGKTWT